MNNSKERLNNIQALRFVAAGLVLLTHITFYINSRVDANFSIWYPGAAGASLFFVLSGVVIFISSADLAWNRKSAGNFILRRFQRIFPLYWSVTTAKVLLVFLLPTALIKNQASVQYVLESYLLIPVQSSSGKMEPIHGVGWTLIHEMFFYYVFAVALFLRQSPVLFSSVVISSLCVAGKIVEIDSVFFRVWSSEQNLLFVAGMLIAYGYYKNMRISASVSVVIFVAGLILMLYEPARRSWSPAFGRFDFGAVLVVIGAMCLRVKAGAALQKMMIWLGDGSYSMYLIHPLLAPAILAVLSQFDLMSSYTLMFVTLIVCVVAGQLLFLFIETPLNLLVRRRTDNIFLKKSLFSMNGNARKMG